MSFGFQDIARYIMYDNRTVCRRQLLRSLEGEEGRVFVSKLIHGPGAALTYLACRQRVEYLAQPSDAETSFLVFDITYGTYSAGVLGFLRRHQRGIDFTAGLKLIRWYESLVRLVLHPDGDEHTAQYKETCRSLYE